MKREEHQNARSACILDALNHAIDATWFEDILEQRKQRDHDDDAQNEEPDEAQELEEV